MHLDSVESYKECQFNESLENMELLINEFERKPDVEIHQFVWVRFENSFFKY